MTLTATEQWSILDPTIKPAAAGTLSPRLDSLAGKTIGVIWNGRPPGDALFELTLKILQQDYGVKRGPILKKPYLGNIATEENFQEILDKCDAVITGVGDCGSCTSASVLDAITMERRGIPAAMVGAERLANTTGRGMARIQGLPDFPLIVIAGHGLLEQIREDSEREELAQWMASNVESVLLTGKAL
jgi:hypothetical protein